MHKIRCRTLFDITKTDVKHQFNAGKLPFRDSVGHLINDHRQWMLARNQQRNWETIIQLLSLRTQPHEVTDPRSPQGDDPWWSFEFSVEDTTALRSDDREYGQIEQDCSMVPMLIGLEERVKITPMIIPGVNFVFEPADHK